MFCLLVAFANATTFTWDDDAFSNNSWTASTNWDLDSASPNAVDDIAIFSEIGGIHLYVTIDASFTLGKMQFTDVDADEDSYALTSGFTSNTITFDVTTGSAEIELTAASTGHHQISSDIILNDDLLITNNGGTSYNPSDANLIIGGTFIHRTLSMGSNNITVDGSGFTEITAAMSGTGGLTKNGSGTLKILTVAASAGSTTSYTGTTTVNDGTLMLFLNRTDDYAPLTGDITINSGATVESGWHDQIGDSTTININSGTLKMVFDSVEIIGALNLDGTALVDATYSNSGIVVTDTITKTGSGTSTISGTMALSDGNTGDRTIDVQGGELLISADIKSDLSGSGIVQCLGGGNTYHNSTDAGIVKNSSGILTLSGNNTYTGTTTVSGGLLKIKSNTALGTTAGGTLVSSGASLSLDGGITVTGEALTISGTGDSNNGALYHTSGSDGEWAGSVILAADATIQNKGSGSVFTISGVIDDGLSNYNLTIGGTDETRLTAQNTFSGTTTVSGGTLNLDSGTGGALGSTTEVTVNSGATLLLSQSNQINDSANLTLDGGILRLADGADESLCNLTLTADSTIDLSGSGSILNFGGTTNSSDGSGGNYTLTITGWAGAPFTGGGSDQIIFSGTAPDANFLNNIYFADWNGGTWGSELVLAGEIIPVPEASTWAFGGLITLLVCIDIYRRHKNYRFTATKKTNKKSRPNFDLDHYIHLISTNLKLSFRKLKILVVNIVYS